MPKKAKVDEAAVNAQTPEETVQSVETDTQSPDNLIATPVSQPEGTPVTQGASKHDPEGEGVSEATLHVEPDNESSEISESDFSGHAPVPETKPNARKAFYGLNFHELDKDLSPDEAREWNAIYASYRAGSILTGKVAGVDIITVGGKEIVCLVVLDYRIKVLIPQAEMWADNGVVRPDWVLRRFFGSEVDYIVREVDREGECVVASRRLALNHRQRSFLRHEHQIGDLVECRVLAVGTTKLLVECGGFEATLSQSKISYGMILDLREDYRPGQVVPAVYKGIENDRIQLSIKEVNPHPFDNVETRHPLDCRRVSRIMSKYAGGVFCELEKGFTCLCLYSREQKDENFDLGDNVIIKVVKYDSEKKQVFGRIVSAW